MYILTRYGGVEGCLFLIFMLVIFMIVNIPLQNFFNKVMRGHDKLVAIIEGCLILVFARILAQRTAPLVNELVRHIAEFITDMLY